MRSHYLTIIYFFFTNECLSVIENMGEFGVKIPTKLKKVIKSLKGKD